MTQPPITLHDAILALAVDITNDTHVPDDVKLRWLDMLIAVTQAASCTTIDAVESMSLAMTNAANDFGDNDDDCEEEGDDFGDDSLDD